jgi:hypothetical protein
MGVFLAAAADKVKMRAAVGNILGAMGAGFTLFAVGDLFDQ